MVRANKKGVIRIIEAIIAVLILLGVVLTLLSRQPIKVDFASSVYKVETQILNEIEGKNNLRTAVLNFDKKTIDCFISSRLEKYALDFNTTICNALTEACFCSGAPRDKEVYSADVLISTNVTEQQLNFKKLLICAWIGKMSARTCCIPSPEVCDNIDNDCNNQIDEIFPNKGQSCNNGQLGECRKTGIYVCKADKTGTECNAAAGIPAAENLATTGSCIDGKDNDCDGATDSADSGCQAAPVTCDGQPVDATKSCPTGLPGECATGTQTCQSSGTWTSCSAPSPQTEVCDGLDNDCDGSVDEGGVCLFSCSTSTLDKKFKFVFENQSCTPLTGSTCSGTGDYYKSLTSIKLTLKNAFYNQNCVYTTSCNFGTCSIIDATIGTGVDISTMNIGDEKVLCLKTAASSLSCTVRMTRISLT
jgi:hypothetical protein